jgi:hypothetical protein
MECARTARTWCTRRKTPLLLPYVSGNTCRCSSRNWGGNLKLAMAALPRIDRRCRDPAGPPAPARPDHPGERGVTKFCTLTERTLITGITDAPIPWPLCSLGSGGRHSLVVYKDLAKAVRRESEQAICHWWNVCPTCVWKWRRALVVGIVNEGTRRLFRDYTKEPWAIEALAKAQSKAGDPERRRKIAESLRGKPMLPHVLDAMRNARRGLPHTEETRRRMSEAHRRRGTLVPGTVLWSPEDDELVRTLPVKEVARRTGRSLQAVYKRRSLLQVPDGRRRG